MLCSALHELAKIAGAVVFFEVLVEHIAIWESLDKLRFVT
jgi:hypothetical protein